MDGLTLAASVVELRELIGGRIEKIQQPEKYELLFTVHANGVSKRLLISSSPDNCRVHITGEKRISPIDAPIFLMQLRKYLTGSRIAGISQPNLDRIVVFSFDALNELSEHADFRLICEIMGKHSNVILTAADGTIIDAIRRVPPSVSSVRLILPKLPYAFPPVQQKTDPSAASAEDFLRVLSSDTARPDKALSGAFYGLSPSMASMLLDFCRFGSVSVRKTAELLAEFYSSLLSGKSRPCIITANDLNMLLPFTPYAAESVTGVRLRLFDSVGSAADEFYRIRSESESAKHRTASLGKVIANNIRRIERKLDVFALSIREDSEIERLRLYGELLTANMYAIPARSKSATAANYYLDPPEPVTIPLDETLSASDNAQQYFKKYRKAAAARRAALVQREAAIEELDYLEGLRSDLEHCLSDSDFDELRRELAESGYIRDTGRRRAKLPQSRPHRYISSDGIPISVGKNNTQNDRLTFKQSSPDDMWLHTKDIHGSHVIIHCAEDIPSSTLSEAAVLAAYYSRARESSSVPVDFTRRRYVKKPSGARPGMVIYTNQQTVYVTPEREIIDRLAKPQ